MTSYIDIVPPEVWEGIFKKVDSNWDKVNLRLVCKTFREIVDDRCEFDICLNQDEGLHQLSHIQRINELTITNIRDPLVIIGLGLKLKYLKSLKSTGLSIPSVLTQVLSESYKLEKFELNCTLLVPVLPGPVTVSNMARQSEIKSFEMYQVTKDRVKANASIELAKTLLLLQAPAAAAVTVNFPKLTKLRLDFKLAELGRLCEFYFGLVYPFVESHAATLKDVHIHLTPHTEASLIRSLQLQKLRNNKNDNNEQQQLTLSGVRSLSISLPTSLTNHFVVNFLQQPQAQPKQNDMTKKMIKLDITWDTTASPSRSNTTPILQLLQKEEEQAFETIQHLLVEHKDTLEEVRLMNINLMMENAQLFNPNFPYHSTSLNDLEIVGRPSRYNTTNYYPQQQQQLANHGAGVGGAIQDFTNLQLDGLQILALEGIQLPSTGHLEAFINSSASLKNIFLDELRFQNAMKIDQPWITRILTSFPALTFLDIRASCLQFPMGSAHWDAMHNPTNNPTGDLLIDALGILIDP